MVIQEKGKTVWGFTPVAPEDRERYVVPQTTVSESIAAARARRLENTTQPQPEPQLGLLKRLLHQK